MTWFIFRSRSSSFDFTPPDHIISNKLPRHNMWPIILSFLFVFVKLIFSPFILLKNSFVRYSIASQNLGRLSAKSRSEYFLFFLLDSTFHVRIMSSHSARIFFKTFFLFINFHNFLWSVNGFCFEMFFFLEQVYFITSASLLPSSVNLPPS